MQGFKNGRGTIDGIGITMVFIQFIMVPIRVKGTRANSALLAMSETHRLRASERSWSLAEHARTWLSFLT